MQKEKSDDVLPKRNRELFHIDYYQFSDDEIKRNNSNIIIKIPNYKNRKSLCDSIPNLNLTQKFVSNDSKRSLTPGNKLVDLKQKKISQNDESDSDLGDENDLNIDSSLKNIKKSMDEENIFIGMKTNDLQSGLNERKSLLLEKSESSLLNKKEMNEIDKGFKIMKNTQNIKENKNIIKICDLLKNLCLLYIKTGSCLEMPNLKSFIIKTSIKRNALKYFY